MPPLAVMVVDAPAHSVALPTAVAIAGNAFTVIVRVTVFIQPLALVPATVYTVVTVGEAITVAPVVTFNPAAGDQL